MNKNSPSNISKIGIIVAMTIIITSLLINPNDEFNTSIKPEGSTILENPLNIKIVAIK